MIQTLLGIMQAIKTCATRFLSHLVNLPVGLQVVNNEPPIGTLIYTFFLTIYTLFFLKCCNFELRQWPTSDQKG